MKKVVTALLVTASLFVGSVSSFAYSIDSSNTIPTKMNPGTIVEYDETNQMIVIDQGKLVTLPSIYQSQITQFSSAKVDIEQLQSEEEFVEQIKEEAKDLPVYKIENPLPQPGLRVLYDGEGYIKEFIYPQENVFALAAYKALPRGTRKAAGTYTYGSNNNKITITSSTVLGEGRFTNFTDTTGENSNTLKKGDAATRGDIDNPKYEQVLDARNLDNNVFANVTKRDNGALPDATLDIWKTGVELFDLKWSSSLSFKGRYFYSF
ncbi:MULTISPECIES: hypothetical protein [unclassified Paenibacillus]|uniref:hypothetical protein n=1 Tax=unclassified Paenibacillus TaxID=185978 RepID=UPI000FE24A76|nr:MULTISPECIES: hypothetical protein [unclassified Paenibacillus]MCM3173609.1 hypothetical protein [Paenibacillus sp. MER 99-2]